MLGQNWKGIILKYDMEENDVVDFKLDVRGFNLMIYKSSTSAANQ